MTSPLQDAAQQGRKFDIGVFALLAAAFAAGLFNHGFVPSMEPRFAEVVREMMNTGEWIIPIKNGLPYVEYPVFYYWLAIAGKALGLPMTAAIRLPSYIAFFAWLFVIGRWSRFLPTGLPALAYQVAGAAMPIVIYQFYIAQTDGILALGVLLSMYGYTRLIADPEFDGFPWAIWIGAAVAMLAKGPVGIACTLPIIFLDRCYIAYARTGGEGGTGMRAFWGHAWEAFSVLRWVRGLALILLVSLPWYILAGFYRGWDFINAILIYQNFERYLTGYSHGHPWWYYLVTMIYDFLPLSLLIPLGLWVALRRRSEPVVRLVALWFVFTYLFFTMSGSKQGKYLLPMAPAIVALAFLAFEYIWHRYRRNPWRWVRLWSLSFIALLSLLSIFVVPFYSHRIGNVDGYQPIREQIEKEPGQLIHFGWPRSMALYELGAPMPYVRSSRALYEEIASGKIRPGDYILVLKRYLGEKTKPSRHDNLVPYPNPQFFEVVLETKISRSAVLLRVVPGAAQAEIPPTPEPPVLNWRDEMFDTD